MWKLWLAIAVAWLLLLPPLFTAGRCSEEFDEASARLERDAPSLRTYEASLKYWSQRGQPVKVLSRDDCRRAKPRFLSSCGSGPLVQAELPVGNAICSLYRDDAIHVRLQYDEFGRLARLATDMAPFRSLPIPFTGVTMHWAR